MKKELLLASALVGSFGLAGVANAATSSMSGSVTVGVEGEESGAGGTSDTDSVQSSELSFSVSETTDSGIQISTSLSLVDEGGTEADEGGITLTFTDGSTLDLIEAGSAFGGGIASIPAAGGSQGVTNTTTNSAPTDLDWADTQDAVGFDWGSAADAFGVEGLTFGVSGATGDTADSATSVSAESTFSVGATLATDLGDTAVTLGAGYINASAQSATAMNDMADSVAVSVSAVTGNLTVGAGFSNGDGIFNGTTAGVDDTEMDSVNYLEAGASYVSGDMTLTVSMVDSEAKDITLGTAEATNSDKHESISASVAYAVASGVTATVGYTDVQNTDEGAQVEANGGSAWYVGASISF
jgi:hypothetical protein